MYTIYTDGSYQDKIKAGGYAVIIIHEGKIVKKLYQGYKYTTNNRMELKAVLAALEYFDSPEELEIYSDSQYVVHSIQSGCAKKWFEENDTSKKNLDLWQDILDLLEKHNVVFHWIKGHDKCFYNELADMYCVHAARCLNIPTDVNYVFNRIDETRKPLLPKT